MFKCKFKYMLYMISLFGLVIFYLDHQKFRISRQLVAQTFSFGPQGSKNECWVLTCTKITLKSPPNPCETSERMNFNVIDKKQLINKNS
jgi:hypothetical protein